MNELPRHPKELLGYLVNNGFRSPSLEAKLTLSKMLNVEVEQTDEDSTIPFDESQLRVLRSFWQGLEEKQPIQYQLGYTFVSGLKILISKQTLCPGSQVEHFCAAVRFVVAGRFHGTALDLCTGCGVMGVVLAKENPDWRVFGVDISEDALAVAERNRDLHGLANLSFHQGDLFTAMTGLGLENSIDLLISNPPYCRTARITQRPEQVQRYVPRIALNGGTDGLNFFRAIFKHAGRYLKKGAYIVLEHEIGRVQDVRNLMDESYHFIEASEDASGDNRVFIAQYVG